MYEVNRLFHHFRLFPIICLSTARRWSHYITYMFFYTHFVFLLSWIDHVASNSLHLIFFCRVYHNFSYFSNESKVFSYSSVAVVYNILFCIKYGLFWPDICWFRKISMLRYFAFVVNFQKKTSNHLFNNINYLLIDYIV